MKEHHILKPNNNGVKHRQVIYSEQMNILIDHVKSNNVKKIDINSVEVRKRKLKESVSKGNKKRQVKQNK